MANPTQRDQVFISYSHKDRKIFEQLQTALKPLVRGKKISVWDDTKIKSGDAWREEIKKAIASAKVALLLVSSDFLASDFIADHELPPLLDAAQNEGLRILWAAVRPSLYEETEIARYQAVNDPIRPLASISGAIREKELVRICKEIKAAVLVSSTDSRDVTSQSSQEGSADNKGGAPPASITLNNVGEVGRRVSGVIKNGLGSPSFFITLEKKRRQLFISYASRAGTPYELQKEILTLARAFDFDSALFGRVVVSAQTATQITRETEAYYPTALGYSFPLKSATLLSKGQIDAKAFWKSIRFFIPQMIGTFMGVCRPVSVLHIGADS